MSTRTSLVVGVAAAVATSAIASEPTRPPDPAFYGVFVRLEPASSFEFRHPPEQWFPSTLYPREALYNLDGGIVRLRLPIDEEGHPTDCAVERSSGVEALDRWSCFIVGGRGRFEPRSGEAASTVNPVAIVTVAYTYHRGAIIDFVCRHAPLSPLFGAPAALNYCDDAGAPD